MTEQSEEEYDEVYLSKLNFKSTSEEDDPFNLTLDEVRSLKGLNRNFVRAADRAVQKKSQNKKNRKRASYGLHIFRMCYPII